MLGPFRIGVRRLAESVAAGLLAALFIFFIVQIASRYVFNRPLGWTTEACLIAWLWLVFWGAGLLVTNREHVRFDVLAAVLDKRGRRVAAVIAGLFIVGTFALQLPAAYDFVSFMGIERSGTLRIPLNVVFSVFVLFAVGVVVRQAYYLFRLLRGADPDTLEPAPQTETPAA